MPEPKETEGLIDIGTFGADNPDTALDEVIEGTGDVLSTAAGLPAAAAGAVAGGITGLVEGAIGAVGGETFGGEAYADSMRRFEEMYAERAGTSTYKNTIADAQDVFSSPIIMLNSLWQAAADEDPLSAGYETANVMGEDAIMGLRWTAENPVKAMHAFPVSTLMMLNAAAKGVRRTGAKARKIDAIAEATEPLASKVRAVMDTEIPGVMSRKPKEVGLDRVPGTIYTKAIGDEGMTIGEAMTYAGQGAAAGALVGVPEWGAMTMLGGKALAGHLASKGGASARVVGGVGRVLRHTSSQARVSDEVAVRSMMQHGAAASAAMDNVTSSVVDALKNGVDLTPENMEAISRSSGLADIVEMPSTFSYFDYDGSVVHASKDILPPSYRERRRSKARFRLDDKAVAALDDLDQHLRENASPDMAGNTVMLIEDLLSGRSAQYAKDHRVMKRIIDRLREMDPDISGDGLRAIERMAKTVAEGPIFGRHSMNPYIKLSTGDVVNIRDLATDAWVGMKEAERRSVLGGVASSLIEENKAVVRSQAAARGMAIEADRIFAGDAEAKTAMGKALDANDIYTAADIYTNKLLESTMLRGDAVPMVSPRGLQFGIVANRLQQMVMNPESINAFFEQRLGQSLDADTVARARARINDIQRQLVDPANEVSVDLANMGSDISRYLTADGLGGNKFRQQMENALDAGVLDEAAYKRMLEDGVSDSFNINLATQTDGRSVRAPLRNTYSWLGDSVNNLNINRLAKSISSWVKAGFTTMNVASHVNNALSNVGLQAMSGGVSPVSVVARMSNNLHTLRKWRKDKSSVSKLDAEIMDAVTKMGFVEGDLIAAEISALSSIADSRGASPSQVSAINRAASGGARAAKALQDHAGAAYRLGDSAFKFDEAIRSMRFLYDAIDELGEGDTITIPTSPTTRTTVTIVDGVPVVKGSKRRGFKEVAAANARMKANALFFDYSQRPGVLRFMDRAGGATSILNPYLTWYWKAVGIGGEGLAKHVIGSSNGISTSSPALAAKLIKKEFYTAARKAVTVSAIKAEAEKHPEALEKALAYAPTEVRQKLFLDVGDPYVMGFRDISSMDAMAPTENLVNIIGNVLGKFSDDDRDRIIQATGEGGVMRPLMELVGLTGGPVVDVLWKMKEGDDVLPEEVISLAFGTSIAQTIGYAGRSIGGSVGALGYDGDYGAYDKLKRLPEWAKPTAEEYIFRRLTSIGWDKRHIFGTEGGRPGKLTRYFSRLKKNLKQNLVQAKLDELWAGAAEPHEVLEALTEANMMLERRALEVVKALKTVYPDAVIPPDALTEIKLTKRDLK